MRFSLLPILFLLSFLRLQAQSPCEVFDLSVVTGDCHPNTNTYVATINFQVANPTNDSFIVTGNNLPLGVYPLTALPLTINNFPYNGGPNDVVQVCILGNGDCCRTKEFPVPACILGQPCEISNLTVVTGDCTGDSTYNLTLNFQVANSTTTHFDVFGNGVLLGNYTLAQLPLHITNFNYNGGANDVIQVCMSSGAPCCKTIEFPVPACILNPPPCEVYNLVVDPGECTSDSTYNLILNFQVANQNNNHFQVYGNNILLGTYELSQLPLTIHNFHYNGGANDVIQVCMVTTPGTALCCKTIEFPVPPCILNNGPCEIGNLTVTTGDCTSDSTYNLVVNFVVANATTNHFDVYGNGTFIGTYELSQLPLTIHNFHYNGGANDVIKVCISPNMECCKTVEFPVPSCILNNGPCEIYALTVTPGECHADSTYTAVINFQVENPTNSLFEVWANGIYQGTYPLTALPLTIVHFPYNGGANDVVKVCMNDNPNCCRTIEFPVPPCIFNNGPCEIYELTVTPGECHNDSTYTVVVNFLVANPTNSLFEVWANNIYQGAYPLTALPLTIVHFPYNGGVNDVIKVCMNDNPNCCRTKEFPVPPCILGNNNCEISQLTVTPGDCHSDSTYTVVINFVPVNPTNQFFEVWGNNVYLGYYPLTALPLTLEHFPYNGGANDVIKVCINDNPNCCRVLEFPAPPCVQPNSCHIYDLAVKTSACLCGQFFAVLTFNSANTGAGGFDVLGNGVNYGNYPYEHSQPVIIGPLEGNGTTHYEFVVQDHFHPDCHDAYELGVIDCPETPTVEAHFVTGTLTISPNPASEWLSVIAQLPGGQVLGSGDVMIQSADGRTVKTINVGNAGSFSINIADLPAANYHLVLATSAGRMQNTFVKL